MSVEPATPILASMLYALAERPTSQHRSGSPEPGEHVAGRKRKRTPARLGRTGWQAIDDVVLDGGFVDEGQGAVVGLAVEANGDGCRDLLHHNILAEHLLSTSPSTCSTSDAPARHQSSTKAHYIDSTGSFSPQLLHRIILSRLRILNAADSKAQQNQSDFSHTGGYVYTRNDNVPETGNAGASAARDVDNGGVEKRLEERAMQLLDAVSVIRVFDHVGLMEAVGEAEGVLAADGRPVMSKANPVDTGAGAAGLEMAGRGPSSVDREPEEPARPAPSDEERRGERSGDLRIERVVADSDAEGSEEDVDEDYQEKDDHESAATKPLLISVDTISTTIGAQATLALQYNAPHPKPLPEPGLSLDPGPAHQQQQAQPQKSQYQHLLLIPSPLSHLTPLLNTFTCQTTYQALLTHLLRRLRLLARTHHALIVLGTGTVGGTSSTSASTSGAGHVGREENERAAQVQMQTQDEPSAFADVHVRPAGGRAWNSGLDVSVMVARLGASASGAGAGFGKGRERDRRRERGVYVVEVLEDRFGGRRGCWVAGEVVWDVGGGGGRFVRAVE